MTQMFYSKDHEWIEIGEDGLATVGITDHAQAALGDIVFVELPDAGRSVVRGEACAVVESVKAASDVCAPLSGTIAEHNPSVVAEPGSINKDASRAWFFKMRLADAAAVTELLDKAAYDAFLEAL